MHLQVSFDHIPRMYCAGHRCAANGVLPVSELRLINVELRFSSLLGRIELLFCCIFLVGLLSFAGSTLIFCYD
jgi:hypothetical protein